MSGPIDEHSLAEDLERRTAEILAPYGKDREGPSGFPATAAAEAREILAMGLSPEQLAESVAAYRRKAADQEALCMIALEALQASEGLRGSTTLSQAIARGLDPQEVALLRPHVLGQQAAAAREVKSEDDEARHAARRAAIIAEAGDVELVASRAFAESLVDGVKRRLGDVRGTSAGTIERTIRRILEERR